MRSFFICSLLLFAWIDPASADLKVYFGNLHAHSGLSDGRSDISPSQAYQYGRNEGGLDFMSLSEHNHMLDNVEMEQLMSSASSSTKAGKFVGLFGQEFSTISNGNHLNIQNYPLVIPKEMNNQYRKLMGVILPAYQAANPSRTIFAEFNHPGRIEEDYGLARDYGGDWSRFVADMDPFVRLIAIANGPADSSMKGFSVAADNAYLLKKLSHRRWFEYLSQGLHLAPKIDHDTHSLTYGRRVAGRTAVWVDGSFTQQKLLEAINARHVYAVQDRNLRILPSSATGLMPGDIVSLDSDDPVSLMLELKDDNEPGARYRVALFVGQTGNGELAELSSEQDVPANGLATVQLLPVFGLDTYHVIKVEQQSADPDNGSQVDVAWLAPIWFEWANEVDDIVDEVPPLPSQFVGSKRSRFYHDPRCPIAARIAPHNLVEYSGAPEGKEKHNCPAQ